MDRPVKNFPMKFRIICVRSYGRWDVVIVVARELFSNSQINDKNSKKQIKYCCAYTQVRRY